MDPGSLIFILRYKNVNVNVFFVKSVSVFTLSYSGPTALSAMRCNIPTSSADVVCNLTVMQLTPSDHIRSFGIQNIPIIRPIEYAKFPRSQKKWNQSCTEGSHEREGKPIQLLSRSFYLQLEAYR